jgi:hypothetical protein
MLSKELLRMTIICLNTMTGNYKIGYYNFALFLYECETWSFTLREGRRLKLLGHRVLRRTFGPKRDEVTSR